MCSKFWSVWPNLVLRHCILQSLFTWHVSLKALHRHLRIWGFEAHEEAGIRTTDFPLTGRSILPSAASFIVLKHIKWHCASWNVSTWSKGKLFLCHFWIKNPWFLKQITVPKSWDCYFLIQSPLLIYSVHLNRRILQLWVRNTATVMYKTPTICQFQTLKMDIKTIHICFSNIVMNKSTFFHDNQKNLLNSSDLKLS